MNIIDRFFARQARRLGFVKPSARRDYNAGDVSRLFEDWIAGVQSKDDKIQKSLVTMRKRARDLSENDPYAKKFIGLCKTNIVGPRGFGFKNEAQDPDGSLDKRANGLIKEAWTEWSKKQNCTVTKSLSWTAVQHLVAETEPVEGEVLVRRVRGFSNSFGYALQFIEPDRLDEQYNVGKTERGTSIRMGVEYDAWGAPVAYHIRKSNPNDSYAQKIDRESISASEIIHKYIRSGVKQSRGVPWFHPVELEAQMLKGFDEAALVAARVGASKMGFIETMPDVNTKYAGDGKDASGNKLTDVSPGSIEELPMGKRFASFDPAYPHEQYPNFVKARLRRYASGLLVSYNSLSNDLEGVNYSSIRAGLLEERDIWKTLQDRFVDDFALEVFPDWLMEMLLSRRINLPVEKFVKFNKPKFIGRGWDWVDPSKDVDATIKAIENGLSSRAEAHMMKGTDEEATYRDLEQGDKMAAEYTLHFTSEKDLTRAEVLSALAEKGLITPTATDEEAIRLAVNMPPLPAEASAQWKKEGGARPPQAMQPKPAGDKKPEA